MFNDIFYQCQLTETTVRRQTCRSTRTHYSDSEPTSLCSFSLMLRAQRRSNKYQFYNLQFDPTGLELRFYRTRGEHANHYANDSSSRKKNPHKRKRHATGETSHILKVRMVCGFEFNFLSTFIITDHQMCVFFKLIKCVKCLLLCARAT